METRIGKLLDRYEIEAKLGHGAMGVVYRARDPKLDRIVAIKTVSLSTLDTEAEQEYRRRFVVEAQAAGRLSHPGIVTIFDVREEPEPFLVMEYVEGHSLQQLVSGESLTLPLSTTLRLVQEVAEALHYAHSQGVVHRDIKPANILVTPDGHPKIADFGVAKLNQTDLTLPGQILGSPAFMAPEQLTEEKTDARSDLFSLGVILYYMLTGHRPFQGNSTTTVCFKLVNHEPVPVSAFESRFSPELDRIVSQAMAKDPAQRYQSGMAMASDLQALRESSGFLQRSSGDDKKEAPLELQRVVHSQKALPLSGARRSRARLAAGGLAVILAGAALWGMHNSKRDTSDSFNSGAAVVAGHQPGPGGPVAGVEKETTAKVSVAPPRQPPEEMLQIEVEHHFTDARASVWLDNRLIYTKSLHAEKQRRTFQFRAVTAHQFDAIKVPSGIHQVRVRVHSAADSYDQSRIIVDAPIRSASLLRITCGRKGAGLQLALQKEVNH
jgi:serine/threonine protein kinase